MLPNSSATGNAILFLVANVFGRGFPNVWGLCTPHTWGHPNTQRGIYIRSIYRDCKIAVYRPITAKLQSMLSCKNRPITAKIYEMYCKWCTKRIQLWDPWFLAAEFSAVDFNSAQCAELKNLDSLPSIYLRGGLWWVCGGFAYKPTTQTVSFARCFLYTFLFLWWVWWVLHKKST